jgi:PilZ domain
MGFARRSGRIAKQIRILLIGTDTSGRVFAEETQTVTLSRHGAGVISKHDLAADGMLILRFLGGNTEVSLRLVGQLGEDVRGYVYGVTFVDPNLDFWELKFPAPPRWSLDFDTPLHCSSCQNREMVDQSEVEADVYALAQSILRFCSHCGVSTQWRRATEDRAPGPAKSAPVIPFPGRTEGGDSHMRLPSGEPGQGKLTPSSTSTGVAVAVPQATPQGPLPSASTAVMARAANRRRDVRTRVSFTVCVRQEGEEEIVECGNISKGGFSFRSRKTYVAGSAIEVALPYYPGTELMFVGARVRHALVLPNNNFHYGAIYASTKPIPSV